MDGYEQLAGELTLLLRAMKELHAEAVDDVALPCELAGTYVLGRVAVLGPVRLTRLAQELGLDPSSVSRHVSSLERHGLVAREKDASDLRAQQLVLTAAGEQAVADLRAARARALQRRVPDWSPTALGRLTTDLARLNKDLAAQRVPRSARQETA